MPKLFIFDSKNVSYKKYKIFTAKRIFIFLISQILISFLLITLLSFVYDTPKEKRLKAEADYLLIEFDRVNQKISDVNFLLNNIKNYDSLIDNVFEYKPTNLEGFHRSKTPKGNYIKIVNTTSKRIKKLDENLEKQKIALDIISDTTILRPDMIASIPATQPIKNDNLEFTGSGWGYRFHPINKKKEFHTGQDFFVPSGTKVFATGKAKVVSIQRDSTGYGTQIVLDHGYGYKTLYAHLGIIKVKLKQTVHRGDIIALSGNTGTSTGPHLHYEVIKDGVKMNPINYFFNDLTIPEYDTMLELASRIKE